MTDVIDDFLDEDYGINPMSIMYIYKSLIGFFLKLHPLNFFILLFFIILEGAAAIFTIISIAPFADYLTDSTLENASQVTLKVISITNMIGLQPNILIFGLIFIGFNLLRSSFEITLKYVTLKIKYSLIESFNTRFIQELINARWKFISNISQGKILNSVTRETNALGDCMGIICLQIASILKFLFLISFPIFLFPHFMMTLLLLAVIFLLPYLFLQKFSYSLGKLTTSTSNRAMSSLTEIVRSIRLIKAYVKVEEIVSGYRSKLKAHFKVAVVSHTIASAIFSSYQVLGVSAIVITTIVHKNLLLSEISIIVWSMVQALPLIGKVLSSNASIVNYFPSYEQVVNISDQASENKEYIFGENIKKLQKVEFSQVSFSYDNKTILKDVSLELERGKIVAIVGRSGAGKSTVIDLIMGFQFAMGGSIKIDGKVLERINLASYRKRIGYVSQDTILLSGTIFSNLQLAKPNLTMSQAWDALEFADAKEMVSNLSEGLDYNLGENGSSLSGGQQQKIALARAYLIKPDLFVLDEFTSSIDKISETKILKNIRELRLKSGVVLITHNVKSLSYVDYIYFMQDGIIAEKGTFKDLKEISREFRDLCEQKKA